MICLIKRAIKFAVSRILGFSQRLRSRQDSNTRVNMSRGSTFEKL